MKPHRLHVTGIIQQKKIQKLKNPITAKQESQQHLNSASAYCAKCKNELAKGYFFQRKKKTLLHSLFFFNKYPHFLHTQQHLQLQVRSVFYQAQIFLLRVPFLLFHYLHVQS